MPTPNHHDASRRPGQPDEQLVERPARHEGADDAGDADAEHGGDGRQQDPVAGDVVAGEPLQVEHLTECSANTVWYTWAG